MEMTLQNISMHTFVYTPMEAGRNLLALSPPILPLQTHHRIPSFCFSSVLMLHEQSARSLPFLATSSLAQHFPTSVVQQEQRDEGRSLMHIMREDNTCQVILEKTWEESESSAHEEDISYSYEQLKDLEHRILNLPALCYLLPSLQYGELTSFSMLSGFSKAKRLMDVELDDVVALAKNALSASKQATLLADGLHFIEPEFDEFRTEVDEFQIPSSTSTSTSFSNFPLDEVIIVRSTRRLERRKRRGGQNLEATIQETREPPRSKSRRKSRKSYEPDNAVRNFLRGAEKTKLLTVQEETELFAQIHVLKGLEEVKSRLQSEVNREPTMAEWASAAGVSCQALKWQVHCGNTSREKIIYANSRMVVHIAKKYCGRGVNLEDLLQEGSGGLMRSIEKYRKRPGCRFGSYAYFWVKQAIRMATFKHSRTIAIPENAHNLLSKVRDAKRLSFEDGNRQPKAEDIAARVGMTVEKLQKFLCSVSMPVSMDQPIWTDQDTTHQEITADPRIENPEVSMRKHFMKKHLYYLLSTLTPREQTVIQMRFGLEGSNRHRLAEIGACFGVTKERARQLESKALSKLKRNLSSQDRDAYLDLLG